MDAELTCDFVDQTELDNAIAAWVTAQTSALENSIADGCSPVVTHDFVDQTITLCDGGLLTIEWTITDLCDTISTSASFNVNPPTPFTFTPPVGMDAELTCDFVDQTELDNAIAAWVTAQTSALENSIADGCSPVVTHDFVDQTITLCDGGLLTIEWTITDLCDTISTSASFNVNPPTPFTFTPPVGMDAELTCDFVDQTELDNAIAAWVTAQTSALENSIADGCSPVVTHDFVDQTITLCDGGLLTIEWTITDLCDTISTSASFNVNPPTPFTFTPPVGMDAELTCDFVDQTELDNAIAAWVTAQTSALENSIADGCSPVVTHDFVDQTITLCDGGLLTIEWTITDLCDTISTSASFNVNPPTPFTFTPPVGMDAELTCDFVDQTELDNAIAAWVTAQTSALENSIADGCSPVVTHDFVDQTITLCDGGHRSDIRPGEQHR
jgi:large repetitive protein